MPGWSPGGTSNNNQNSGANLERVWNNNLGIYEWKVTPGEEQITVGPDPFKNLSPRSGEVVVGEFQGPSFGPGGDVYLTPREIRAAQKSGFYEPSPEGRLARRPDGGSFAADPFAVSGVSSGGRSSGGGGGGRAAPAPTFGIGALESNSREDLRDKMIGYYESWTGAFPDAPSLDFVTNQALGNKSYFDIRANVQATPEFKSRFKHMPAGMDIREYDQALVKVNAQALQFAGRPVNDKELELYFSGDGDGVYDSFKGINQSTAKLPAPPEPEAKNGA